MKITVCLLIAGSGLAGSALANDLPADFKLPREVTPQMRSACEADVRRLCIDRTPTVAKVKSCVMRNFTRLGMRCQLTLAAAGFGN